MPAMRTRRQALSLGLAGLACASLLAACAAPTLLGARVERLGTLQPLRSVVFTVDTAREQFLQPLPLAESAIRHHLYTTFRERGVTVDYHSTTINRQDKPYPPLPQYLAEQGATHWLVVRIPEGKVLVGTNAATGQQVFATAKSFPLIVTLHATASNAPVWRFTAYVDAGSFQHASKAWREVLAALEADGLVPAAR